MAHLQQPLESALENLEEQASKDKYAECTLVLLAGSLIYKLSYPQLSVISLGRRLPHTGSLF